MKEMKTKFLTALLSINCGETSKKRCLFI